VRQFTDTEMTFKIAEKIIRSQVRLKMSCKADVELNKKLPEFEKQFMAAVKAGRQEEFVLAAVSEVLDEIA
jgi:hypothetical protein